MADNRIPTPASGTLGTTPTIQSTTPSAHAMPRWAYLALALACAGMGLWSSIVTLQFFEHGATALETDAALQALAKGAALLFVFGEMAAFTLAALLTGRALQARRWMLYGFAGAVLLIEIFTISAVQMAMVTGADLTQTSVAGDLADLQKQIDAAEKSAASFTATAEALRADKQVSKAMKADDKATAERDKASRLYDRLETARKSKRPTLTGLLGEKTALSYAIARGILVSLAGLVFFGTAGALLRSARGGALSVDQQILELLHKIHGGPAVPAQAAEIVALAPAQTVAPAPAPAPAPASFKPVGTVAPKDASTGFSYTSKTMMAGAGLLAATAAPMAHSAPAVPAAGVSKPIHAGVSETIHADHANEGSSDASNAAPAVLETSPAGVSKPIHDGVLKPIQQIVKKPRAKRAVSAKLDTGVEGHAGARFKRIRAGVVSGKIRPSVRGIQAVEGGSQEVVADYLRQLETEGLIVRAGRGFALVQKGHAAVTFLALLIIGAMFLCFLLNGGAA